MLKMACRSRSRLATNSSESVLCDGMMAMSFGQFATYEALRCVFGEVLPTENGRRLFHYGKEKERRKDDDWIKVLGNVIKLALWPFEPGGISVSRYELGAFGRELMFRFDVENFPEYPFKWAIDERQIYQAYFPEQFVFDALKDPLFRHFRYRPCHL